MIKAVKYFGSTTTTGVVTIDMPSGFETGLLSEYARMDVVCNVLTLTGTTPKLTFFIKEAFPLGTGTGVGTTFVTTGQTSGGISTTGMYVISYDASNAANNYVAPSTHSNPLLGKGMQKKIVINTTNTISAFYADFALVFYN